MACTRFGAVFGGSAPPAIDISTEQAPLASHSTKQDSTHWYHYCFLFLASHLIHHVSLHPASSALSGNLSPVDLPSHGIGRNPARGVSNVTAEGRWIVQQAPSPCVLSTHHPLVLLYSIFSLATCNKATLTDSSPKWTSASTTTAPTVPATRRAFLPAAAINRFVTTAVLVRISFMPIHVCPIFSSTISRFFATPTRGVGAARVILDASVCRKPDVCWMNKTTNVNSGFK